MGKFKNILFNRKKFTGLVFVSAIILIGGWWFFIRDHQQPVQYQTTQVQLNFEFHNPIPADQ